MTSPVSDVPESEGPIQQTWQTNCCIVGGGPGGVALALLLARAGVPVTLLEAHHDFDRDFRGDTIHPATLEMLDQIGLAEPLHALPHAKLRTLRIINSAYTQTVAEFARLRTRFPYIMLMPQVRFLEFLIQEARQYPHFRLMLGANVTRLIEAEGTIQGVRYHTDAGWHEVRAPLTVAADGRFSRIRKLLNLEPVTLAPPMDVIWLRLPRQADDPDQEGEFVVDGGQVLVLLGRDEQWQVGYVIPKGGYQQLRHQGLGTMRQKLAALVPWLSARTELLQDWSQCNVLSVASDRLPCWHRPGLLFLGDAAHVMSPVGGVGINYAIGDAVEAVNLLADKLRDGKVSEADLAGVQRRRSRIVWAIQKLQTLIQNRVVAPALDTSRPFRLPWVMRLLLRTPVLRNILARLIAFGIRTFRLERPEEHPPPKEETP